jgi:hypothetical protein
LNANLELMQTQALLLVFSLRDVDRQDSAATDF